MKRLREAVSEPAFPELDDLLQHRARVGAAVLLARHDRLSFSRLKELLNETDGNLGANMRRLEDAGYVIVRKEFRTGGRSRGTDWRRRETGAVPAPDRPGAAHRERAAPEKAPPRCST